MLGRLLDGAIEERLRERGFVGLVVAPAAVAVHVDEDVGAELAPEIQGQLHDLGDGFRVFAVDVEDGRLEHARHVGGIDGRARLPLGGVVKPIWLLTTTWSDPADACSRPAG